MWNIILTISISDINMPRIALIIGLLITKDDYSLTRIRNIDIIYSVKLDNIF
jgi:hypothetical protein